MLEKFINVFKQSDYKEVFSKDKIKKLFINTILMIIDLTLISVIFIFFSNHLKTSNVITKTLISASLFILNAYFVYYVVILIKYIKYIKKKLKLTFDRVTFLLLVITTIYSIIHAAYSLIVGGINNSNWEKLIGSGYLFSFILRIIVLISIIILYDNKKVSPTRAGIIENKVMIVIGILIIALSIYVITPLFNLYTNNNQKLVNKDDILSSFTAAISIISFLINFPLSIRGLNKAKRFNNQLLTCARSISFSTLFISLFTFLISISLFIDQSIIDLFNKLLPITQVLPVIIGIELIVKGNDNLRENKRLIKLTKNLKISFKNIL